MRSPALRTAPKRPAGKRASAIGAKGKFRAAEPRTPHQRRSRERYELLLDVADEMLAERELRQVGIHDIAKRANVPPPSVYHFFPAKEAVFVALAERYLKRLLDHNRIEEQEFFKITRWQALFRRNIEDTCNFYNKNPSLLKLFFGASVLDEIREKDVQHLRLISASSYETLNQIFVMPYLPDAEIKFATVWSISDGITMASYRLHGFVTDEFRQEMIEAALAYCRTFLPEVLPLRLPASRKAK